MAFGNPILMTTRRQTPSALAMVAMLLAACLLAGCIGQGPVQRAVTAMPFGHEATLIFVPGIGDGEPQDAAWMRGLRTGGYEGKAESFAWASRLDPVAALWDHKHQRQQARHIAGRIRSFRNEAPTAPIILVGHSAGAGLVVLALEDLPPGTQVDGVVLLAPALSRTYDLTNALRHVNGHVDVFCSDRDTLVLGIGTFLFGTVDGVPGEAAGHGGFVRPRRAAGEQYAKLHTHHFSHARESLGDDGGHFGCLNSNLAAAQVAPLLPRSQMPSGSTAVASEAPHVRPAVVRPAGSMTARGSTNILWSENSPR